MKNSHQINEITREDFNSPLMWKVFRKLIRQETPFVFFLKIVLIAAFFMILVGSIVFIGSFPGN